MKQVLKDSCICIAAAAAMAGTIAGPAVAQPGDHPPDADSAPAPGGDAAPTVSLGEVLQVAVRQQPALVAAAIDVQVADAAVLEAAGIHDWIIDATGRVIATRSQGIDRSFGVPFESELEIYDLAANATRFFGIGGTLSLHFDGAYRQQKTTTDLGGASMERDVETFDTNLSATYTQSLLRGRGRSIAQAAQRQSALLRDAAALAHSLQASVTVRIVIDAYWDLALAQRELEISQNSLGLARERLRNTRVAISAGSVAATEALAVEQTIALREEDVLLSELAVTQRALELRRQAGLEIGPRNIAMATSAPLGLTPKPLDTDALLARAFANSPQIAQLETLQRSAQIDVEVTDNGLLPELDFGLTLGTGGSDESAREALEQTATLDNTSISAALTLRHNLGNRAARGAHRRARSELLRRKVDLADVKAQIAASLALAVKQAQVAQQRVDLSQRAIELAEQNIAAEQARFDLGRATNFDVLERQDELRQAQLRRARATVAYLEAISAIDSITGDILPKYGIQLEP